jgi:GWxTD domain-containing protein
VHRIRTILISIFLLAAAQLFAADEVMKWNKSPEAYFMTPEERTAWGKVASPEDARKFIDDYFRKRGDAFTKEIRTRIDIADKEFRLDKTPGALTARGRVWMILGNPSRSRTNRNLSSGPNMNSFEIMPKTIEGQGLIETEWTYDSDKLPAELGRKSLVVNFQTDSSRGYEAIVNQGIVEPYLTLAATRLSKLAMADTEKAMAQRGALPSATATVATGPDPLWNATENLNGAMFTGESYLSPLEEPFYAYSVYVPQSAVAFKDWSSALLVTLVRDASGQQILADRKQLDLAKYDDQGNRFVDRSVALSPGKYEGLFAVYTPDGATLLASHRANFEVAAKDAPRATALLLTSKVDVLENQQPLDPFTFVATKYAVRADHKFRPTDKLAFFTVIANPTGSPEPKLMQKMVFKKDGAEFFRSPLEPVQLTQTGPNTFLVGTAFDPETFPAGHYTLELQVRDMNAADGSDLRTKGYVLTNEFEILK